MDTPESSDVHERSSKVKRETMEPSRQSSRIKASREAHPPDPCLTSKVETTGTSRRARKRAHRAKVQEDKHPQMPEAALQPDVELSPAFATIESLRPHLESAKPVGQHEPSIAKDENAMKTHPNPTLKNAVDHEDALEPVSKVLPIRQKEHAKYQENVSDLASGGVPSSADPFSGDEHDIVAPLDEPNFIIKQSRNPGVRHTQTMAERLYMSPYGEPAAARGRLKSKDPVVNRKQHRSSTSVKPLKPSERGRLLSQPPPFLMPRHGLPRTGLSAVPAVGTPDVNRSVISLLSNPKAGNPRKVRAKHRYAHSFTLNPSIFFSVPFLPTIFVSLHHFYITIFGSETLCITHSCFTIFFHRF